jgi:hypothetical protein
MFWSLTFRMPARMSWSSDVSTYVVYSYVRTYVVTYVCAWVCAYARTHVDLRACFAFVLVLVRVCVRTCVCVRAGVLGYPRNCCLVRCARPFSHTQMRMLTYVRACACGLLERSPPLAAHPSDDKMKGTLTRLCLGSATLRLRTPARADMHMHTTHDIIASHAVPYLCSLGHPSRSRAPNLAQHIPFDEKATSYTTTITTPNTKKLDLYHPRKLRITESHGTRAGVRPYPTYVRTYVHTCVRTYVGSSRTYVRTRVCTHVRTHVHRLHVRTSVHVRACARTYAHVRAYMCTVRTCVRTCACACTSVRTYMRYDARTYVCMYVRP